jgi:hypothetical protein
VSSEVELIDNCPHIYGLLADVQPRKYTKLTLKDFGLIAELFPPFWVQVKAECVQMCRYVVATSIVSP